MTQETTEGTTTTPRTTLLGALVGGLGLGAGLMYLLDPDRGARRRHLAKDKAIHLTKKTGRQAAATCRDLAHRTRGAVHEARKRLVSKSVPGPKLENRVRSELGHHLSDPSAVNVSVRRGRVVLSGSVPEDELEGALAAVTATQGVREVHNRLNAN